jgi:hypothetical protein
MHPNVRRDLARFRQLDHVNRASNRGAASTAPTKRRDVHLGVDGRGTVQGARCRLRQYGSTAVVCLRHAR